MATLYGWIVKAADGKPVEAVVIGRMGWGEYKSEKVPNYSACPKGVVLTWEEALPWLQYEFCSGYGAPSCQAVYAWTADRVIFISQYDGATGIEYMPRHPTAGEPNMPGG